MSAMEDLRPGDIMFGPIGGAAGLLVGLGQLALGDISRKDWRVRHVGVVVEAGYAWELRREASAAPRLVQAMPTGAEEVDLTEDFWTPEYIYVRPQIWEENGLRVAAAARGYVGTPYSFLDYLAITGVHLGVHNGPVRRRVTSSKHMICSQLADQAMSDAGWHVFSDGRLPQDVTPGALFTQMMTMNPARVIVPGA